MAAGGVGAGDEESVASCCCCCCCVLPPFDKPALSVVVVVRDGLVGAPTLDVEEEKALCFLCSLLLMISLSASLISCCCSRPSFGLVVAVVVVPL